jgi:hypothetical protein
MEMRNGPQKTYVGSPVIYAFIEQKLADGWRLLFEIRDRSAIQGHYLEELARLSPLSIGELGVQIKEFIAPSLLVNQWIGSVTARSIRERLDIGQKDQWAEELNDTARGLFMARILDVCTELGAEPARLVIISGTIMEEEAR